MISLSV